MQNKQFTETAIRPVKTLSVVYLSLSTIAAASIAVMLAVALLPSTKKTATTLVTGCPVVDTTGWVGHSVDEGTIDQAYGKVDVLVCQPTLQTLTGQFTQLTYDNFETGRGWDEYGIRLADGIAQRLFFTSDSSATPKAGSTISVTGYHVAGNALLVKNLESADEASQSRTSIQTLKSATQAAVIGEQRITVARAYFQGSPTTAPSLSNTQTIMGVVANFYAANSYNAASLNVTILTGPTDGWYVLPVTSTCDFNAVQTAAIAAVDSQVNFGTVDHFMVIANGGSCGYGGMSTLGKESTITLDGTKTFSKQYIVTNSSLSEYVAAHELGHGFGVHHASSRLCNGATFDDACTVSEYGDMYSIMGTGNMGHMNSQHKSALGWLTGEYQVQEVTASGTYTVYPIETPITNSIGGVKALKIAHDPGKFLYVDLRLQKEVFNTCTTSTSQAFLYTTYPFQTLKSLLLDATPDAACPLYIPVGSTVVDPFTGTRVTIDSITENTTEPGATAMRVTVVVGKTDFTAPSLSISSPAQFSNVNGTVQIQVNATDASGIEKVDIYHDGSSPENYIGTLLQPPYEMSVDTLLMLNKQGSLNVFAYDNAGAPFGAPNNKRSGFVIVNVNNPILCGDTNNDQKVNVGDVTKLVSYLFKGDSAPYPFATADVDLSSRVDVADLTYLVNSLFKGGPALCQPPASYQPLGTDWNEGQYAAWYNATIQ
jgi:M6 family metalloprotease-like protein